MCGGVFLPSQPTEHVDRRQPPGVRASVAQRRSFARSASQGGGQARAAPARRRRGALWRPRSLTCYRNDIGDVRTGRLAWLLLLLLAVACGGGGGSGGDRDGSPIGDGGDGD